MMKIDGIFYVKGRGQCITGRVPLDEKLPGLGDPIHEIETGRLLGFVRGVEMSIGNFGMKSVRREHIGIILGSVTRITPPKVGDEVCW